MSGVKSFLLSVILLSSPGYALEAELTSAPNVPHFITRTMPETVVVNFQAREFVGLLAEGKHYKFWSFNGTVPGPMIRVRQGDTVEFHLSNHSESQFPHNIDIHAVNGPGGGSSVSLVGPGDEKAFRFKTLHPGLYVYHCASPVPSIPAHIANGMYGLLLVEPRHGFPRVDHEFYVFESEFYTRKLEEIVVENLDAKSSEAGKEEKNEAVNKEMAEKEKGEKDGFFGSIFGSLFPDLSDSSPPPESRKEIVLEGARSKLNKSVQELPSEPKTVHVLGLSLEKGLKEQPDHVLFNGRQGALLRENALRVNVGEKIRIYFGNIGPNGISSLRIMGEVFDQVYLEGAVNGITNRNVQTTLVPSGGTTIVEFTIDVPGDYLLVDHSIFRINKGAIGLISAVGEERPEIFEPIE